MRVFARTWSGGRLDERGGVVAVCLLQGGNWGIGGLATALSHSQTWHAIIIHKSQASPGPSFGSDSDHQWRPPPPHSRHHRRRRPARRPVVCVRRPRDVLWSVEAHRPDDPAADDGAGAACGDDSDGKYSVSDWMFDKYAAAAATAKQMMMSSPLPR
ncbi:unnamed protein product [Urochloa humidicola]